MASIFGTGLSGILAAQSGLQVTQHNITNASTTGYTRQSIQQTSSVPLGYSTGFIGNGTKVTTVTRQYNAFLTDQVRNAQTNAASLETYSSQIGVLDDLLSDTDSGVSSALADFFSSVQEVSSSPASLPARQSMVSSAQALVARFQSTAERIGEMYGSVNSQIADNIDLINTYSRQIANVNQQILSAESAVGKQPANDLRDQRDQLISDLNKLVKTDTVTLDDGSVEVFIGSGQLLVMGSQANMMSSVRSSVDPSRTTVALDMGAGMQELPESLINGGVLGGLLSFRSETLDSAMNSLGKMAASAALTFNAQHAQGMDLLGNNAELGVMTADDANFVADFFEIPSPTVIPSDDSAPVISASFTEPKLSSLQTSGNYYTNITDSDYKLEYTGVSGSEFKLTKLTDGTVWNASSISALNTQINDESDSRGAQGFSLSQPAAASYTTGQSYLIEPTRNVALNIQVNDQIEGDVRRIAAAQPLRASVTTTNSGSGKVTIDRVRDASSLPSNQSEPASISPAADTPSYPVTFQFVTGADGKLHLQLPAGSTNTYQLNAISSSGSLSSTANVTSASTYTNAAVSDGTSFELWDGNSRVLFSISGTPKSGDSFTLAMNDGSSTGYSGIGVSDSGNIVLLGKLQTQKTMDGGDSTYQEDYAQLVSDVGNKAREVSVTLTAQQTLADQASEALSSESSVNLDEEAANLLKYQQLYQASARAISVGQTVFDELLNIVRG